MGMGIAGAGRAVGGPARVADADVAPDGRFTHQRRQAGQLAHLAADFDFAIAENDLTLDADSPVTGPTAPALVETTPAPRPRRRRYLGMEIWQLVILGVLALALVCIAAGFAYYFIAIA